MKLFDMRLAGNNRGFSLIELIVTAAIIGILAGAAITYYIGTVEKAKIARIRRTAGSATADLGLWLQASLSEKRYLNEIDTNMDGVINNLDKTNSDLLGDGNDVVDTYITTRNTVLNEKSPWSDRPMWNNLDPLIDPLLLRGTINLQQPQSNRIIITAREKNGIIVYQQNIFI